MERRTPIIRFTQESDEDRARGLIPFAKLQMSILRELMGFQNLTDDVRRTFLTDGLSDEITGEIRCRSTFDTDIIWIHAPRVEEERVVEFEKYYIGYIFDDETPSLDLRPLSWILESETWSLNLTTLGSPRIYSRCFGIENEAFIVAGKTWSPGEESVYINLTHGYNAESDSWFGSTDIPEDTYIDTWGYLHQGRTSHQTFTLFDEGYMVGGFSTSECDFKFNRVDNSWKSIQQYTRWFQNPLYPDNSLYVCIRKGAGVATETQGFVQGNIGSGGGYVTGYSFSVKYDPFQDAWTDNLNWIRSGNVVFMALFCISEKLYSCCGNNAGGTSEQEPLLDAREYDPVTDSSKSISNIPYTRKNGGGMNLQDAGCVLGGREYLSLYNRNENFIYNPIEDAWTLKPGLPCDAPYGGTWDDSPSEHVWGLNHAALSM